MLTYYRTSGPTDTDIISLLDLKNFLKVENTADDTLIPALLTAARKYVEDYTGVLCNSGTVTFYAESWAAFRFAAGPVTAVDTVSYKTDASTYATLATTGYAVSTKAIPQRLQFYSPPSLYNNTLEKVKVTTTAGYAEAYIPAPMVQAMRLLVGHWYEQRSQVIVGTISSQLPLGIHALLNPYRIL
jgi:uncharacterized phiE125 gp8 family phage protein